MPAVLNAANEAAVAAFLENRITFLEIEDLIQKVLDSHETISNPDLETIQKIDDETRQIVNSLL
jgi:1-deoxy-D-xylulose-5-phosphate reductoisomerase